MNSFPGWNSSSRIRIAHCGVAIDAFSQSSVDFNIYFFLCGHRNDLEFINQTMNFVSFPFKVQIDGVSVGAV